MRHGPRSSSWAKARMKTLRLPVIRTSRKHQKPARAGAKPRYAQPSANAGKPVRQGQNVPKPASGSLASGYRLEGPATALRTAGRLPALAAPAAAPGWAASAPAAMAPIRMAAHSPLALPHSPSRTTRYAAQPRMPMPPLPSRLPQVAEASALSPWRVVSPGHGLRTFSRPMAIPMNVSLTPAVLAQPGLPLGWLPPPSLAPAVARPVSFAWAGLPEPSPGHGCRGTPLPSQAAWAGRQGSSERYYAKSFTRHASPGAASYLFKVMVRVATSNWYDPTAESLPFMKKNSSSMH